MLAYLFAYSRNVSLEELKSFLWEVEDDLVHGNSQKARLLLMLPEDWAQICEPKEETTLVSCIGKGDSVLQSVHARYRLQT
jgi:hypothetical protein